MNYNNLSYLFRNGANPGFHEGIADILSLAVGTASYYQRLGLLDEDVDIGKKHALKKYDLFALNTSCFCGSTESNFTAVMHFHEIFLTK